MADGDVCSVWRVEEEEEEEGGWGGDERIFFKCLTLLWQVRKETPSLSGQRSLYMNREREGDRIRSTEDGSEVN